MGDSKMFSWCTNGTDVLYHHAEFGAYGSSPLAWAKKFDVFSGNMHEVHTSVLRTCCFVVFFSPFSFRNSPEIWQVVKSNDWEDYIGTT